MSAIEAVDASKLFLDGSVVATKTWSLVCTPAGSVSVKLALLPLAVAVPTSEIAG